MATDTQVEVVMPQMGVSVSEGTITKWLKSEGEPIARDEALLEISTDKVDTEIPSPAEGVVAKILVQEGETVEVGTPLAVIAPEGAAVSAPEAAAPEPATAARSRGDGGRLELRGRRTRRRRSGRASPGRTGPGRTGAGRTSAGRAAGRSRANATLGQRPHVRLSRRRSDRLGARGRPEHGAGHRDGRPRDQEGHPRLRRGGRPGRARRSSLSQSPWRSRSPHRPQPHRLLRRPRRSLWRRRLPRPPSLRPPHPRWLLLRLRRHSPARPSSR